MTEKIIPLVINQDEFVKEYLALTTFQQLTPLERDVLALIYNFDQAGRREKQRIRTKLNISVHSMNNVVSSLKRKGFLQHNETTHSYTPVQEIPKDLERLVFTIEKV